MWSYFYDTDADRLIRGISCSSAIRRFLRWAGGLPGGECYGRVLPMVPAVIRPRKPFDCMTEEEDDRLVSYILGEGCALSLRDAAIVTVARFCGLRACDVASLRMDDVDLGHSRLSVRQRKTGVPLAMPLRPVVGNAVIRYVMKERPESDLPELFLVEGREVRPLSPSTVTAVCDKVYRLAGIRQDGHRRGCHLPDGGGGMQHVPHLFTHGETVRFFAAYDTMHKPRRSRESLLTELEVPVISRR